MDDRQAERSSVNRRTLLKDQRTPDSQSLPPYLPMSICAYMCDKFTLRYTLFVYCTHLINPCAEFVQSHVWATVGELFVCFKTHYSFVCIFLHCKCAKRFGGGGFEGNSNNFIIVGCSPRHNPSRKPSAEPARDWKWNVRQTLQQRRFPNRLIPNNNELSRQGSAVGFSIRLGTTWLTSGR